MFRVEITVRARADADEAYEWFVENISSEYAERWYRGLLERIETLQRHPTRCPLARESRKFPEEIRELTYGRRKSKYRIIFTIRQDTVVVLYIYHSARDELKP